MVMMCRCITRGLSKVGAFSDGDDTPFEVLIPLVDRCFEQADENSDNDVTLDEFKRWVTHNPTQRGGSAALGTDPLRDLWKLIAGHVSDAEKEEALHPTQRTKKKMKKKTHTGRTKHTSDSITDPNEHARAVEKRNKTKARKTM